jgi:hypothetical protein
MAETALPFTWIMKKGDVADTALDQAPTAPRPPTKLNAP